MQNNTLDILHRRYIAYLESAENDAETEKLLSEILRADSDSERFDTAIYTCEIKTDWLERIEHSLEHLDRAVRENRQFILRQGETVPIEKVRRVSKTSVEHLARHSEYITREPEEDTGVIPEKLLMTENVGTYAVYENRFLYMLLCYIRDFVEIKHNKISELSNSFSSEVKYDKCIVQKKKRISFCLCYSEESKNPETDGARELEACLVRMKNIISFVDSLLKTPLMTEVSTAPMLKPPISRTNVLLHDPSFSAAMELYDYLCAYKGEGYEKKDLFRSKGRIPVDAREDYAQLVAITSYFSHRHGGQFNELQQRYITEENRRAEERKAKRDERINALKKQLGELDGVCAEFILLLEDKCEEYDREHAELIQKKELYDRAEELLKESKARTEGVLKELELANAKLAQEKVIQRQKDAAHQNEIDRLEHISRQKDEEKRLMTEEHLSALNEQKLLHESEYNALYSEYQLLLARLRAIKCKDKDTDEDFSSKEAFAELDAEFEAFKRFYDSQWKKAKKNIRKEQLWKKENK